MSLRDQAGINAGDPTRHVHFDGVLAPPSWTKDALCTQVDPELFFPDKGGSTRAAKKICGRCPVRAACLEYALDYESGAMGTATSYGAVGVYGGLSAIERRRLRQRRQLDQPPETHQESA